MYQHKEIASYQPFENPELSLVDMIDPMDQLYRLTNLVNWTLLCDSFINDFQSVNSPSSRLVFGLLYLQAKENITFDELLDRWLMTPEWQYFCGETSLKSMYPISAVALSIWSRELGAKGAKAMCAALSPSFVKIGTH